MNFTETELPGAVIVDPQLIEDDRGFFTRTFCSREFEEHGLLPRVAQCNLSFNHKAGPLRGMHFQVPPAGEAKFVRCVQGAILDVIVDLRPDSPTYLRHISVELTAANRRALYIPPLFAHGYQALADESEVLYQVSEFYTPSAERSLRFDDPLLGISWPREVTVISEKDCNAPGVKELEGISQE